PDFRYRMRREGLVAPHDAIGCRDLVVLRRFAVDGVTGAWVLDVEVDVEELELIEESLAQAAASASWSATAAHATRSARRTAASSSPTAAASSTAGPAPHTGRCVSRWSATPVTTAHHAAECHDRRTAKGVV